MTTNLPKQHSTILMAVLNKALIKKEIEIYIWPPTSNGNEPRVKLKNMQTDRPFYDPITNAQSICALFGFVLPSDTTDILYKAIADRMRELIDNSYAQENLLKPEFLESHIQSAMTKLLEEG